MVEQDTKTVFFDIDGTLTTSDLELVQELAADLLWGNHGPEMYDAADQVVSATFITGANAGNAGTTAVSSYPEHQPSLAALPVAAVPAPAPLHDL